MHKNLAQWLEHLTPNAEFATVQGTVSSKELQRDVVYLGWPIAPSYMSPKFGGREGVGGSQPMSTAVHRSPNKLWRSNSKFNLWFPPTQWNLRGGRCSSVNYKYKQKYLLISYYALHLSCKLFSFLNSLSSSLLDTLHTSSLDFKKSSYLEASFHKGFMQEWTQQQDAVYTDHNFSCPLMFPFYSWYW